MDVRNISNLKWRWYYLVAKDLIDIIQELRNDIAGKNGIINQLSLEILETRQEAKNWKDRAMIENKDAAIAVEVIRENMRTTGLGPSILTARDFAATQRIKDLESEVEYLRNRIKNAKL